jgi:hypothetical protein
LEQAKIELKNFVIELSNLTITRAAKKSTNKHRKSPKTPVNGAISSSLIDHKPEILNREAHRNTRTYANQINYKNFSNSP